MHLIEFRDTEHRVTRDAELADLRAKITSLYPKGKCLFFMKIPDFYNY